MASSAIKADYVVSMANGNELSPDVDDKLRSVPGVTATSPMRNAPARIDGTTEYLTGVTGAAFGELTDLKVADGAFTVARRAGRRRRGHRQVPSTGRPVPPSRCTTRTARSSS